MTYRSAQAVLGIAVCALLAATGTDGLAQSAGGPRAWMAAKAFAELPPDFAVVVDYREDTELNGRLRAVFERELKDRGYRVVENANFVLTFETLVEEKLSADKPASVVGRGGNRSGSEIAFQMRLPLDKPKPSVGGRRYSLNVTLALHGKPPIWVASAVAVAAHGDRFVIQKAMVRALVNQLGREVANQPIAID